MLRTTLTVLLLALVHVAASGATLYRWKDADGNMVVSDRPPPSGVEYETVSTSDTMVVNTADPVNVPARGSEPESRPEVADAAPAPSRSVYKKNPEYCKGARQNLEVLARPRIRVVGEDGEAHFLTEEEREEERRKAMETIEAHCE